MITENVKNRFDMKSKIAERNFQTYKNINMKYLTNKLTQFKQWILSIVRLRLLCEKEIERRIKELDLQLTNAKNRDIRHLESVAIDLLDCETNIKHPLTVLYIAKYSALDVSRILELGEFVDMNDPFIINVAMGLANKGCSNKLIIEGVCKANEA